MKNTQAVTDAGKAPREDYKSEKGIAAWWQKDGAWHIALPGIDCFGKPGFLWTADQYATREAAIAAIER